MYTRGLLAADLCLLEQHVHEATGCANYGNEQIAQPFQLRFYAMACKEMPRDGIEDISGDEGNPGSETRSSLRLMLMGMGSLLSALIVGVLGSTRLYGGSLRHYLQL